MLCVFNTILLVIPTTVCVNAKYGVKQNLYLIGDKSDSNIVTEWNKSKYATSLYRRQGNNISPEESDVLESQERNPVQDMVFAWFKETAQVLESAHNETIQAEADLFNLDSSLEMTAKTTQYVPLNFDKLEEFMHGLQPTVSIGNDTDNNETLTYKQIRQEYAEGKRTTSTPSPEDMEKAVRDWMADMDKVMKMAGDIGRGNDDIKNQQKLLRKHSSNSTNDLHAHKKIEMWLSGIVPTPGNHKQIAPTPTVLRQGDVMNATTPMDNRTESVTVANNDLLELESFLEDYNVQGSGSLFGTTDNHAQDYGPAFTPDLKSVADDRTSTVTLTEPTSTRHPVIEAALKHKQEKEVGYFSSFISQFFLTLTKKSDNDVRRITRALELVMMELQKLGRLADLQEPFLPALNQVLPIMSAMPGDTLKEQAKMAHDMLDHRDTMVTKDILDIVVMIDSMYLDEEGEKLLDSLVYVVEYPNNGLTNMQVMRIVIVDALLSPYRRLSGTEQRKKLIHNINQAISKRFPMFPSKFNRRKGQVAKIFEEFDRNTKNEGNNASMLRNNGRQYNKIRASAHSTQNQNNHKHKSNHKHSKRDKKRNKVQKAVKHLKNNHPKIYKKYVKHHKHKHKNKKTRHKHKVKLERTDHKYEKLLKDRINHKTFSNDETKTSENTDNEITEKGLSIFTVYGKLLNKINKHKTVSNYEIIESEITDVESSEKAVPLNKDLDKRFAVVKTTDAKRTVNSFIRNIKKTKVNKLNTDKKLKLTTSKDTNVYQWQINNNKKMYLNTSIKGRKTLNKTTKKTVIPNTQDSEDKLNFNYNKPSYDWKIQKRNITKKRNPYTYPPIKASKIPSKTTKKIILRNKVSSHVGDEDFKLFGKRRYNKVKRKNKISELSSYSEDEEVILKSNIYKAFGYNNNFFTGRQQ